MGCVGKKPIANKSTGGADLTVKWLTGVNSLQFTQLVVLPPSKNSTNEQRWNFVMDGEFRNLHVWIKVLVDQGLFDPLGMGAILGSEAKGKEVWLDDNMCCKNPFHFRLQASAVCTREDGFHKVQVDIPKLDKLEFKHTVHDVDKGWYQVDYGSYDVVETTLKSLFRQKAGEVRIKNADGTVIEPMVEIGHIVEEVIMLNTGHHCPQ